MGTQFFCPDHITKLKTPLSATRVRVAFLELLRYGVRGGMEEKGESYIEEIALLFDQLISLVAAAEALRQEGGASDQGVNPIFVSGNDLQKGDGHE